MAHRPTLTPRNSRSPVSLAAFGDVLATNRIAAILASAKAVTHRHRKLPFVFTAQLCIAMSLWSDESIDAIAHKLLAGPQLRGLVATDGVPSASAMCQRRQALGVAPLQALFTTICRPLSPPVV